MAEPASRRSPITPLPAPSRAALRTLLDRIDADDDAPDAVTPADAHTREFVELLVDRGALEPSARDAATIARIGAIAAPFLEESARERPAARARALSAALVACELVTELYASDEDLAELLARW